MQLFNSGCYKITKLTSYLKAPSSISIERVRIASLAAAAAATAVVGVCLQCSQDDNGRFIASPAGDKYGLCIVSTTAC